MCEELWKVVAGFEGMYEVSSHGRIRSLQQKDQKGNPIFRIMKWRFSRGYPRVHFTKKGKSTQHCIHVLVLEAFVGPRPEGMLGCHNDGDRAYNHPHNLRWDTHEANMKDLQKHGSLAGDRNPYSKLTEDNVHAIRKMIAEGMVYGQIAEKFDVCRGTIKDIARKRSWSHLPDDNDYVDRVENERKKRRGANVARAILTEEDIPVIRQLIADGMLQKDVAKKYGVSPITISAINTGRLWSHV